jgi:hypothetical protein
MLYFSWTLFGYSSTKWIWHGSDSQAIQILIHLRVTQLNVAIAVLAIFPITKYTRVAVTAATTAMAAKIMLLLLLLQLLLLLLLLLK